MPIKKKTGPAKAKAPLKRVARTAKVAAPAASHLPAAKTAGKSSRLGSSSKKATAPKLFDIFVGAGFRHVAADAIHIDFMGRVGEIDHIFVWENVVLLCEETAGKDATKHCTNKIHFHKQIPTHWSRFYREYGAANPDLVAAIGSGYKANELEVRHVYYSEEIDVVDSVGDPAPFRILTRSQARYFGSLVQTIRESAKYELMKFLGIALHQIGAPRIRGSGVSTDSFTAFAMPAAHTNFPPDFMVVSFYADPLSLLQRAYVMRRDGWESPDLSYQRFVRAEKLVEMRKYLRNNGQVFITNLIVTLPSTALIKDAKGKPIDPTELQKKSTVVLELPLELGTVGIVDGQHRIFSYYEDSTEDATDDAIGQLRARQNLLVTGIIFPANFTPEMRVKFEAGIFLGINNNQSPVNAQLRQDLEVIISPETMLAIARTVVTRLSKEGPLANMLNMSEFDPPDKISTGSLAPHVVETLMRKNGSLHKQWTLAGERDLADPAARDAYIDYSVNQLKLLLQGASHNMKSMWKSVPDGGVLSTTVVGGLLLLLERFAREGTAFSRIDYKARLKPLATFSFKGYTGSSWGRLANAIYATV